MIASLSLAACSGNDANAPAGGSAGGEAGSNSSSQAGAGASACSDLAGTWTIASHCNSALVGMQVMVAQSGCTLTTGGAFAGLSGELKQDGGFDLHGTFNGMDVQCNGSASAQRITESCTASCNVTLTR